MRVRTRVGDIVAYRGDALVNAANSTLLGGSGVDGAIHLFGGDEILADCRRIRRELLPKGLPPGEAVASRPGRLGVNAVIHTVGPVWKGGGEDEAAVLASCYRKVIQLALREGWRRIAFPAISTGVYGYPPEKAARVVVATLAEFAEEDLEVLLVFFRPQDRETFLRATGHKG